MKRTINLKQIKPSADVFYSFRYAHRLFWIIPMDNNKWKAFEVAPSWKPHSNTPEEAMEAAIKAEEKWWETAKADQNDRLGFAPPPKYIFEK